MVALLEATLQGGDLPLTAQWVSLIGICFQKDLLGTFTPPTRLGILPFSLASPCSDSAHANADSSPSPSSVGLPTHSKTGWWEEENAPFALPSALRTHQRALQTHQQGGETEAGWGSAMYRGR